MIHADVEKWITMPSQQIQRQAALPKDELCGCAFLFSSHQQKRKKKKKRKEKKRVKRHGQVAILSKARGCVSFWLGYPNPAPAFAKGLATWHY